MLLTFADAHVTQQYSKNTVNISLPPYVVSELFAQPVNWKKAPEKKSERWYPLAPTNLQYFYPGSSLLRFPQLQLYEQLSQPTAKG